MSTMTIDEDVVVELESDLFKEGADKTGAKPNGADAAEPDAKTELKAQFAEAQKETERERDRRVAAESRATAAEQAAARARQEAETARTESVDHQYETVESGLDAAKAEATAAEQEYKTAFEAGDPAVMASAQRKIARAEAKIVRLDEAKSDLEARKKAAPAEALTRRTEPTHRTEAPADPVEAYISGRTQPTQDWLRAHTDWVTDTKKNAKLNAAHHDAIAEGLSPDSKEYFDHVETFIGLKTNGAGKAADPPAKDGQAKTVRRAAPPAAPVNATGGGASGGGTEVRLTKGEAERANDGTHVWGAHDFASGRIKDKGLIGQPIGNQEFARRKYAMQQQGLYDKTYVEQ